MVSSLQHVSGGQTYRRMLTKGIHGDLYKAANEINIILDKIHFLFCCFKFVHYPDTGINAKRVIKKEDLIAYKSYLLAFRTFN